METKKITFLIALFFSIYQLFSQQEKDSTAYFINQYQTASNVDTLVSAYKFLEKKKEYFLSEKYHPSIAYYSMYVSAIEDKLGQYHDSQTSAIQGIKSLNELPETDRYIHYRIFLLNTLGIVNRKLENYDKALENYFEILTYSRNKSDSIVAQNNIGIVYKYLGNYIKANDYFEIAYKLSLKSDDEKRKALAIGNYGYTKARLSDEESGVLMMKKAIEIRRKNNDPKLYESYKNIVDYYKFKGDVIKAKTHAIEAYQIALDFKSIPYMNDALSNLIDLGQDTYALEFKRLRDSLMSARNLADNKYSEAKFDISIQKEKTRNAELRAAKNDIRANENEIKANRNMFILILGAFVFILITIFLRRKYKRNTLKKQFEIEQQISKKLHDEVANDVFHTMFKVQGENVSNEELVDDLEVIYNKTRDLSKSITELRVSNNFGQLLEDLVLSYQADEVNIFTNYLYEVPWDSISKNKKKVLYRVVQELMTNMQKHSLADLVSLSFEKKGNKIITKYADNGVGTKLKKGNGLQNVESRIKMVNGSIKFDSEINNGFHVQIIV